MSDRLVPCPGCARHVRASSEGCPFCGATLVEAPAPAALPAARLGRAALFAFGAAALAATGCAEHHGSRDAGAQEDSGVEQDAGDPTPDAGRDAGNIAPPYGAPPDDAGFAPLYGGAP